jgi:hypothetical protein
LVIFLIRNHVEPVWESLGLRVVEEPEKCHHAMPFVLLCDSQGKTKLVLGMLLPPQISAPVADPLHKIVANPIKAFEGPLADHDASKGFRDVPAATFHTSLAVVAALRRVWGL